MKKTLIITLEFPPQVGGIATYVNDLADAFEPAQTVVLAPILAKKMTEPETSKYKLIRRKLLFPRFIWPRWIKLCWLVLSIVKKEKIELIIVHHVLPAGYAACLAHKIYKIPYLVFSHGTDIAALSRTRRKSWLAKKVCLSSEQIVCNSDSLARRLSMRFPEFKNKVSVVYPCPNELFARPKNQERINERIQSLALSGKKVILSVGRMIDGKGFPHLARIIAEVAKTDPNIVWVVIGVGPKLAEVVAEVNKNSLQNIVRFMGEVPHDQIVDYFQLADLFILLTHPDNGLEEGLGLVFLEAAAAGLPVIAGKSGGVEEAVVNGQTGLVFDVYREAAGITDAVISLLQNSEYRRKLGNQAHDRIIQEFNWSHQLARISTWLN